MGKIAVIIGAGPAGLTAALELLRRTDITPIVLEATQEIGGISRTICYKGNRMDIGGHRFFSKSDRVMNWWLELMPAATAGTTDISYQHQSRTVSFESAGEQDSERVMLIRPRKSRIYYLRRFFDYPIRLSLDTLKKLGLARTVRVGLSYLFSRFHQIKPEKSLEDFFINRFGRQLYLTFFKSYTEKVWGVPCQEISAEWGAQRIKGLSLSSAILHFIKSSFSNGNSDVSQKNTETSLIEQFLYPKLGPGQLWEYVAQLVEEKGGQVLKGWKVTKIHTNGASISSVEAENSDGETRQFAGDYFFSTMPVKDLIRAIGPQAPENVQTVSEGLQYRDFITVGLLANRLGVREKDGTLLKDTWIYVQEPDVLLGRLQIFNNWSPYMIADPSKVWIGLEYFCYENDSLWSMKDDEIFDLAVNEIEKIGIISSNDVIDGHVVRVPKTYPAYFGSYEDFPLVREYTDGFQNLFLVGRNGMHKYNNQDHSMLTAMTAVDNIVSGITDKSNLWEINTEQEYHEESNRGNQ